MDSKQLKMKIDPLTGEEFTPKSRIQRFATAANQKKYNNLKASLKRSEINNNLRPLLENEKILQRIIDGDEFKIVSKDYLLGAGFDFRYSNGAKIIANKTWQFILSTRISKADKNGTQFEIRNHG